MVSLLSAVVILSGAPLVEPFAETCWFCECSGFERSAAVFPKATGFFAGFDVWALPFLAVELLVGVFDFRRFEFI